MISFYRYYNRTDLDHQHYASLIEQLYKSNYTKDLKIIAHIIKKHPWRAYMYAKKVIKGRWLEAETNILRFPYVSFYYAKDVIKGRWPEAESAMRREPYYAHIYATYVINGRWIEAEPTIKTAHHRWCAYCKEFGIDYLI